MSIYTDMRAEQDAQAHEVKRLNTSQAQHVVAWSPGDKPGPLEKKIVDDTRCQPYNRRASKLVSDTAARLKTRERPVLQMPSHVLALRAHRLTNFEGQGSLPFGAVPETKEPASLTMSAWGLMSWRLLTDHGDLEEEGVFRRLWRSVQLLMLSAWSRVFGR